MSKFEGTFSFSIDGERWELEPGHVIWAGTFKGKFSSTDPVWDGTTWECPGMTENKDGKSQTSSGYCIVEDSDGDKAWATWTGKTETNAGAVSGMAQWRGGTGKFDKIKGHLTYSGEVKDTGSSAKVEGSY